MATTKTKKKTPANEVGRKALSATFDALETAGKRLAKFAHEGKKKFTTEAPKAEHKTQRKAS